MAVRPRIIARPRVAAAEQAPEFGTLEQRRARHPLGSFERVALELEELIPLDTEAKRIVNLKNKQLKLIEKAVKAYALEIGMEPSDEIQFGDTAYTFDVTHSDGVDVHKLYALIAEKKITLNQFLNSVKVTKADANKAVGPMILSTIEEVKHGKTAGLRKRELDNPVDRPVLVRTKPKPDDNKLNRVNDMKPPSAVKNKVSTLKLRRVVRA